MPWKIKKRKTILRLLSHSLILKHSAVPTVLYLDVLVDGPHRFGFEGQYGVDGDVLLGLRLVGLGLKAWLLPVSLNTNTHLRVSRLLRDALVTNTELDLEN